MTMPQLRKTESNSRVLTGGLGSGAEGWLKSFPLNNLGSSELQGLDLPSLRGNALHDLGGSGRSQALYEMGNSGRDMMFQFMNQGAFNSSGMAMSLQDPMKLAGGYPQEYHGNEKVQTNKKFYFCRKQTG